MIEPIKRVGVLVSVPIIGAILFGGYVTFLAVTVPCMGVEYVATGNNLTTRKYGLMVIDYAGENIVVPMLQTVGSNVSSWDKLQL